MIDTADEVYVRHALKLARGFVCVTPSVSIREQLLLDVWGHVYAGDDRTPDVHRAASPRASFRRYATGLLGHADVSATMIYTHVLNLGGLGVKSPRHR